MIMEEEQGDVGPVSSNDVSELSLSGDLTRETLDENMASENQVEGSFEEGDGGEIMVEIVGSDVFVDGVSGQIQGDVVAGEVENLGGRVREDREETKTRNLSEDIAASDEGGGNKLVKSELGLSESRGEQNSAGSEKLEVRVGESVHVVCGAVSELSPREVVSNDEVWNPGIEATAVASSAAKESMSGKAEEVAEKSSVVVAEESAIKNEAVDNNGDSDNKANSELQSEPMEVLAVGDRFIADKKEILKTIDCATGQDCLVAYSAVSCEKKSAAALGEVTPPADPNGEGSKTAHVEGVDGVKEPNAEEGRESSPAADPNGEELRTARVDGIDFAADAGSANSDAISPIDQDQSDLTPSVTMSCNIPASEIATPAGDGGEILTTASAEVGVPSAYAESLSSDGDHGINAKVADEKEILEAESEDLIPCSDNLQSDTQDENQGLKEIPGVDSEAMDGTDSASHEQSLVDYREEPTGMDLDDVTEFKDAPLQVDNLPSASNNEILETGEDLETDVILQNNVSSSKQTQLADIGDTSALCENNGLGVENQAGVQQNLAHTTNPSSPDDKEIVKDDSGKHPDKPVVDTVVDEVTNDQNIVISQVNVVEEDGSREMSKVVGAEIATEFIECHETSKSPELCSSTENMQLPENSVSSEVETVEIVMAENLVVCNDPVITECGSPQTKTVDVSVPKTETPNDEVSELESVCLIPNEVTAIAAVSDTNHVDTLQEITAKTEFHVSDSDICFLDGGDIQDTLMIDVSTLNGEVPEFGEAEDTSGKVNHIMEGHTSEAKGMEVEEMEYDQKHQEANEMEWREPESGSDEPASDTVSNDEPVESSSSLRMNQSGYLAAPGNDGQFAVSDLVWGKVRSHPWWPGQIFDPADASEKAVKHSKKDSYLVAYFGDRTFAWNEATLLKPFKTQFSQIEKQSSSEAFQNAVSCALEEVSRRVELGLACSCTPKDAYRKIETQVVENTGIREESSQRYGVDQSSRATSFEPDKLLQYVRDLAPRASSGADRLDIVIARAQLSAFCRFKGYRPPTDYRLSGELLENDADTEQIGEEIVGSHKNKHTPNDSLQSRKKERSLTDLVGDKAYSIDGEDEFAVEDPSKLVSLLSGNKRKALDPLADGSDKRLSVHAAKVSASVNQTPKPSFKIGECIRRVANQLTGSAATVADGSPKINDHSGQSMVVSAESSSVNEMLLQLQLVAQDPKKGHNSLNTIITFFAGFKSSVAVNKRGRKKKSDKAINGSAEEFEFDDVNDSYWTDRIVQNYSEKQLMHNGESGAGNHQLVPFDAERSVKPGRKSRKRFFSGNYPTASSELDEKVKRRKQETSPAELILNFAERSRVPSEINLNKMFRRFGPLMESETEVDHDSARARVIFKRGSDAEVAHSSAQKFSIFGPVLVNYEIGYSPLISVKILPLAMPQGEEDATVTM